MKYNKGDSLKLKGIFDDLMTEMMRQRHGAIKLKTKISNISSTSIP